MTSIRFWDGKEWERHCLSILRLHHGAHELHEVPDRHGGDLGLEAFSADGCAYQCYAAEEPLPTSVLYEKQRDKLTTDVSKLREKHKELIKLLGSVRLKRYGFMVHRHDSHKLVQHGKSKAAEVRAWNLEFIADDFDIVVMTDEAFPRERSSLLGIPVPQMRIEPEETESVASWRDQHGHLLATIDAKLSVILKSPVGRLRYSDELIRAYLVGENRLSQMRDRYPDQWQAASICRANKESYLVLEYSSTVAQPTARDVTDIAVDLAHELVAAVPAIDEGLAKEIAWSSIADWLMRCPLDFFGEENAA
ncbi:hypothetical protein [Pseudofrankia sp. BMG5.36]|uniref:hypothetical protein n=1 Tax=Pseudofrankia sp. BMG5.36 TaxID=1834512 RepID=UPI0010422E30|nr:hypothetical protein [Pseudofrankia sp. BMG5.36]